MRRSVRPMRFEIRLLSIAALLLIVIAMACQTPVLAQQIQPWSYGSPT